MRCRMGDLCVIVRAGSNPQLLDKLCQVLRLTTEGNSWVIEIPKHPSTHATGHWIARDDGLRPLRGSNRPDETLIWAGKPGETPTQIIKKLAS